MLRTVLSAITVLLLVPSGCLHAPSPFVGRVVPLEQVIPLAEGSSLQGVWQTFDVAVKYQAATSDGHLEMTMDVRLSEHYQQLYHNVNYFWLYLFQADTAGRILASTRISVLMNDTSDSYARQIRVPLAEVRGIPAPPLSGSGAIREGDAAPYAAAADRLLEWLRARLPDGGPVAIASQRSTFLLWDRETREPVTPMISPAASRSGSTVRS